MVARFSALLVAACLLTPSGWNKASDKTPQRKAPAPPTDDKGGLEALQGTWLVVAHGDKGNPVRPVKADDDEPWIIKGNKLIVHDSVRRNDIKRTANLKVDSDKKPAHIDFSLKGKWKGKEREWTTYGIYSLKGDELTICVPEKFDPWEPENRPTEFKSTSPPPGKNSGFSVYVFKKKK